MAGFRDIVSGSTDEYQGRVKAALPLADEFPLVAESLAGTPANGTLPEIGPCSLGFYLDGDKAKFVVRVKGEDTVLFGVVADILNPWGSINSALLVGDVSRKRHSEHNGKLSKLPY